MASSILTAGLVGNIDRASFISDVQKKLNTPYSNVFHGGDLSNLWFILYVPIAIIGGGYVFFLCAQMLKSKQGVETQRIFIRPHTAPSRFLGSYFQSQPLVNILHRMSMKENFSIISFFTGGSNALTILVKQDSRLFVKKICLAGYEIKLKNQATWLEKNQHHPEIVKLINTRFNSEYFEINLEYLYDTMTFFDFIHEKPLEDSTHVIETVWNVLAIKIYDTRKVVDNFSQIEKYLTINFTERLAIAANLSKRISEAKDFQGSLVINGVECKNISEIFPQIMSHPRARFVLGRFTKTNQCHGDLTIDNILVRDPKSPGDFAMPILIDPSDDNEIRGPLMDAARMSQSLSGGYEFLLNEQKEINPEIIEGKFHINFNDVISDKYFRLSQHFRTSIMVKYLTSEEIMSMDFHVAILFGRMLSHRVLIDDKTSLIYYAKATLFLNQFFEEVCN
jgi:hypothetical protein